METLILENTAADGSDLRASFLPSQGMNLCSYKKGTVEIIDQSTRPLFEERFAGLGALIGPHFHRRKAAILPQIPEEGRYPHIARVRAKGVEDPFSHGIARYAPWRAVQDGTGIHAELSGKDEWEGVPLADLEGQDFKMTFDIALSPEGLKLKLSVVSDFDSLVGIHYYYALPNGKGTIKADVGKNYRFEDALHPIPESWNIDAQQILTYPLDQDTDFGFHPYKDPCASHIVLETEAYTLHTHYSCTCQENTWQLYHPAGSSFVCIEPMSAQNPRKPQLSVSSLDITLSIA